METTTEKKELLVLTENPIEVFTGGTVRSVVDAIKEEARSFVPDPSTEKGRKEIASLAYKIARSKTALDDAGKSLTEEQRKLIDRVNEERRFVREELDALKDEIRRPLTEYEERRAVEEAERRRLEAERLERERIEREQREAQIAAEAAEKARVEAEQKAAEEARKAEEAREAERKAEAARLAAIAAERLAEEKRAANAKHRKTILDEIAADLAKELNLHDIGHAAAIAAGVIAGSIANGKIRHITINF